MRFFNKNHCLRTCFFEASAYAAGHSFSFFFPFVWWNSFFAKNKITKHLILYEKNPHSWSGDVVFVCWNPLHPRSPPSSSEWNEHQKTKALVPHFELRLPESHPLWPLLDNGILAKIRRPLDHVSDYHKRSGCAMHTTAYYMAQRNKDVLCSNPGARQAANRTDKGPGHR